MPMNDDDMGLSQQGEGQASGGNAGSPSTGNMIGFGASIGPIATNANNIAERNFARNATRENRKQAAYWWLLNNWYNSPAEQVKRLKSANLNKSLMYGNGGDTGNSSMPDLQETVKPNTTDPGPAFAKSARDYFDIQNTQLTSDNLRKQNELMDKEIEVKNADIALKGTQSAQNAASTATTQFELGKSNDLRDTSIDYAKTQLTQAISQNEKTRAEIPAVKAATANTQAATRNLNYDTARKAIENYYLDTEKKNGIIKQIGELSALEQQVETLRYAKNTAKYNSITAKYDAGIRKLEHRMLTAGLSKGDAAKLLKMLILKR